MDATERTRLRALHNAATQTPWRQDGCEITVAGSTLGVDGGETVIAECTLPDCIEVADEDREEQEERNAALIVAAGCARPSFRPAGAARDVAVKAPVRAAEILLVFAPLGLADSVEATAWAMRKISAMWDADPRPDAVVVADDRGPALFARREAEHRGVLCCLYAGSGEMVRGGVPCGRWTKALPPDRRDVSAMWGAWYRHRDRVMTKHAIARLREGARVRALVLTRHSDPWESAHRVAGERARALGAQVIVETYSGRS
jgi:hypothetical protein